MTISNESRDRIKKAFEPLALGLGRIGLTPNALTLVGFGISVAGAVLVAAGLWLAGGVVVFLGGAFDMFDGTLARATGRVSPFGAFLDSVFDRCGEAAVFVGVTAGLIGSPYAYDPFLGAMAILTAWAMAAAFLVSYARARAEGLGFAPGKGMAEIGLMPREVRLIVISLGLVIGGILGIGYPLQVGGQATPLAGTFVLAGALAVIAVGATITVAQRILIVRRQAGREGPRADR